MKQKVGKLQYEEDLRINKKSFAFQVNTCDVPFSVGLLYNFHVYIYKIRVIHASIR